MFINENEVRYLVNLRQEETEKITSHAWKLHGFKKENFLLKAVRKWQNKQENKVVQPNCSCACQG